MASGDKDIVGPQGEEQRQQRLRRRPRRRVLSEDDYLSRLARILRRDFFPELPRLEAQYEYLSAMERADLAALQEAAARLNHLDGTDGVTAGGQDADQPPDDAVPEDRALSLDEFQARYVTEDTAEYEELVERLAVIKRAKFTKVFKTPTPLLLSSPAAAQPSVSAASARRGRVEAHNTRIDRSVTLAPLERDPHDIRHHYWKMRRQYAADRSSDDQASVSTASSAVGAVSQMGGVDAHAYALIDTPIVNPAAASRHPPTPLLTRAEERQRLLRTPAVQRLLKAHPTPQVGSAFQAPPTPQRRR